MERDVHENQKEKELFVMVDVIEDERLAVLSGRQTDLSGRTDRLVRANRPIIIKLIANS
jgi:hypothetical protein